MQREQCFMTGDMMQATSKVHYDVAFKDGGSLHPGNWLTKIMLNVYVEIICFLLLNLIDFVIFTFATVSSSYITL
jgi:hypothetical protein